MIFQQQVNFNNMALQQEFAQKCASHPECKDCELKTEDVNMQGSLVRCETGRMKDGENKNG